MKTHLVTLNRARKLVVTLVHSLALLSGAYAQQGNPQDVTLPDLAVSPEARYFRNMDDRWWKYVQTEHIAALDEASVRARALHNIVYLASYFPEQAGFHGASDALYDIYRHDGDRQHRLLALSALDKIGSTETMRRIARHVRSEDDPGIRRVALATLKSHFEREAR